MRSRSNTKVIRCLLPRDADSLLIIRNLCEQGLLCADHVLRRGDHDVAALSTIEIARLAAAGITVGKATEAASLTDDGAALDIATGFVTDYLDAPGIHAAYTALHTAFPALCAYSDLPEATTGYDGAAAGLAGPSPVKLFRITTTPLVSSKPALLIIAGLHAREWIPPLAAIEFASQLLHNYAPGSADPAVAAINAIVEQLDVLIVGAANPDGINFSRHDVALWRKNRRPNAGAPACPGVDLNRNFSVYWGQGGSSADPCDVQIYRGPSAFSEVENRNIRALAEQFPNILAAIDCHSFGEHMFRPQPTGGSFIAAEPVSAGDDAIYQALELAMNTAIAAVSPGKSYGTGTTSNHSGTFDEYAFFGHRIFAFDLEIGQDFQPPIAQGLSAVQEGAAAMRSLATETLGLSARFVTPAATVAVIDKSSSMIASAYVDATRANAARLVDLMSLNDQAAIVSFGGTATTEFPLGTITSPGVYAAARAAVAAIAFGGSTSIGAGLQRALTLLPAPGMPRSIVLQSDGFENTAPLVSTILPTIPADVAVHTIALGPASDQMLLNDLATATGGTYHFAPNELGLFEIYNATHSATTDADMVLSDTISSPGASAVERRAWSFTRRFVVDCDADFAEVSVALVSGHGAVTCTVTCLSVVDADLTRIDHRTASGYHIMRWRRPQPGIYALRVTVDGARDATCSVAAFVRSPLRLHVDRLPEHLTRSRPVDLPVRLLDGGSPLRDISVSLQARAASMSLKTLARQDAGAAPRKSAGRKDAVPDWVARGLAVRAGLIARGEPDPLGHHPVGIHLVHPEMARAKDASCVLRLPAKSLQGSVNLRLMVQGRTRRGCPFVRVGLRSLLIH